MSGPARRGHQLRDLTWPDVEGEPTVLVPVGSLEQHGPHLPLDTDAFIAVRAAEAVAAALADRRPQVLVAPPVTYGASGEHQAFAGTVSVGHDALSALLVELIRSLSTWSGRVILVNGHGGNVATLVTVVDRMRQEGHDILWLPCTLGPDMDAHAGVGETSVMLHLDPGRVDMHRAVAGNTSALRALMPDLLVGGVATVSATGVLGDPTGASAEVGRQAFDRMVQAMIARV